MEAPEVDIVKMYHPDLNAVGEATREGFHMLYQSRGWELMEGPAAQASEILGRPILKVKDMTNDEIRRLIGSYGAEQPPASATKSDLIDVVSAAAGGQPVEKDEVTEKSDDDDSEHDEDDESEKSDESTPRPKPSGAAKKAAAK